MQLNYLPQQKIGKIGWFVFAILAASAVLSFIAVPASAGDGLLHLYFLDVGQGDSEFIQTPNGNQILIDGGPDNKVIQELGKIMPFNDRSIDMVVLTHPHSDHVSGLIEVLRRYEVGRVLENNFAYQAAEYNEWNNLKMDSEVMEAVAGQVIDLGDGVKIEVVYPDKSNLGKYVSNANNASVVLKLKYGNESVLLTGDIEAGIEKKLVLSGADLDSDFLKLPHHGSKTSSTEQFISAVSPKEAFIEVGAKNTFGHPSPAVIDRLANHGIKYYRTDTDGTVELLLDGQGYKITN